MDAKEVLHYWFKVLDEKDWWKKSEKIDQDIKLRFAETLTAASANELFHWRNTPSGRLAEIIVLDQFSRNIYRDSSLAFRQDSQALALAQEAIRHGYDKELSTKERRFLYMPYMHSESLKVHEEAILLFSQAGLEDAYRFELAHKVIIERFGRYPHRNEVLGRVSTPEELVFLKEPNSSF